MGSNESNNDDNAKKYLERYFDVAGYSRQPEMRAPPSSFEKFWDRLIYIFQGWSESEQELSGRVQKIVPKIDEILEELLQLQSQQGDSADEYRMFIDFVIIPLYKEGQRIKVNLKLDDSPAKYRVISRYILWIDRYYHWIEAYDRGDIKKFRNALFLHIVKETLSLVEKDLCIIADYAQQQLDIAFTPEQREALNEEINVKLMIIRQSLYNLKERPIDLKLSSIQHWQDKIGAERQKMFNEALAIIDEIVDREKKISPRNEKSTPNLDILQRIALLEKSIPKIQKGSAETTGYNDIEKKLLIKKIAALEQEAYDISQDLRLPQVLFERIQVIMHNLEEAFHAIDEK